LRRTAVPLFWITSSAVEDGERRLENNMTGFKLANLGGRVSTGEHGDSMQA
jgi:hypothetical protein